MKSILVRIQETLGKFQSQGDVTNARKYSTYMLAMLTYLRQSTVCPLLVYANCALDVADKQNRSELSKMIVEEISKLGIKDFLNDEESVISSRMRAAIGVVEKHEEESIVIFSCFRTSIDVMKEYLPKDRKIYTLGGSASIQKRADVVEEFKTREGKKGNILLLTYNIGCEGLNLQSANTVLLLDMFWNDGKTQQAIARVLRNGQCSEEVNVYMFTSNTGVESAIYNKQFDKLTMLDELRTGGMKTKPKTIKVKELIKLINMEDCVDSLKKIHNK